MGLTFCYIGGAVLDDDAATLISFFNYKVSTFTYFLEGLHFFLGEVGPWSPSSGSSASVFSMYISSFLLLALGGFH